MLMMYQLTLRLGLPFTLLQAKTQKPPSCKMVPDCQVIDSDLVGLGEDQGIKISQLPTWLSWDGGP